MSISFFSSLDVGWGLWVGLACCLHNRTLNTVTLSAGLRSSPPFLGSSLAWSALALGAAAGFRFKSASLKEDFRESWAIFLGMALLQGRQ